MPSVIAALQSEVAELLSRDGEDDVVLQLELAERDDGWELSWLVRGGDGIAFVDDLPARFRCALRAAIHGEVHDWLSDSERADVLEHFQAAPASYPLTPVHELFEAKAAAIPDRVALELGTASMSYAELNARANRIAWSLIEAGATPGSRVGLHVERSFDLVAAMLGILKAGGVYVPLDPLFPSARLAMIVADCELDCVVASSSLAAGAGAWGVPVRAVDACAAEGSRDDDPGVVGGDHIYVIYTSGSTGRPKGIPQTHRAIANLVRWELRDSGIGHEGVVLQFSSIGFDVHVQEIFATLAAGGMICLIENDDRLDPERLLGVLERHRVSTVFLSVSTLTNLFVRGGAIAPLPATLRHIITAGEQLVIGDALRRLMLARPVLAIHNHYGVSESHVVTAKTIRGADAEIPARPNIGRPIANCRVDVRDPRGRLVPPGVPGEVWIFGACLSDPYLGRPEQSALRFRTFGGEPCFVTGDRAKWHPNGELEFLGRFDDQVKIRGHLVEIPEIEAALLEQPGVTEAAVIAPADDAGERTLRAFLVGAARREAEVRRALAERLPAFMIPSAIRFLDAMPAGATGKIDRQALAALDVAAVPRRTAVFENATQRAIAECLAAAMRTAAEWIDVDTNFFDHGADSLVIMRAAANLSERLGRRVSPLQFFAQNSVRGLAAALDGADAPGAVTDKSIKREPIAIVGMAGRFPGADNAAELWRMLVEGRDGLTVVAPEELDRSLFAPLGRSGEPRVTRLGLIRDSNGFDAELFGFSRYEADWIDPQQRQFLECAYEALEDAGCDPSRYRGTIGVIAGAAESTYLQHLRPHVESMPDYLHAITATDKDFVALRVAYKLGLTGPAYGIQTACSTSLVAVHLACNTLTMGEADVMLAGATSVQSPQRTGYAYDEGSIYSRDGHTRPFDKAAGGTNMSNGVGVVVLKRLSRAVEDRDQIYAVILATAVNNDGGRKVGFAAPSVQGQAEVIRTALARAAVEPATIDYIEAHGTGTAFGDPIEVEALRQAYGGDRPHGGRIALGSIKSGIGHTNRAAGVAGLMKAALVLRNRRLVPTLHHEEPNPALELERSPFWIPTETSPLPRVARPHRAAVSALGIGGTNAHAILEEVPPRIGIAQSDGPELVVLSAANGRALRQLGERLAPALRETPLSDAAFTLATGRKQLPERLFAVADDADEAAAALAVAETHRAAKSVPRVVWMFPGQGAEVVGRALPLYERYPPFRAMIDRCADAARDVLQLDLRTLLFPKSEDRGRAAELLPRSRYAQPATVALELATAAVWQSWGCAPDLVMGHSTGQYAAAVIAGVLDVETAMHLLAIRGRLMEEAADEQPGLMISALLDGRSVDPYLGNGVHLAGWNARRSALFGGRVEPMLALEARLLADGLRVARLANPNPNHTPLMEPMVARYAEALADCTFSAPRIPVIANDSGAVVDADAICSSAFWLRHVRMPVLFADSFDTAFASGVRDFIEVGPSRILSGLASQHFAGDADVAVVSSFPAKSDETGDPRRTLLAAAGQWWARGGRIDWDAMYAERRVARVSLPAYPFQHAEHWLPIPEETKGDAPPVLHATARPDEWLYRETWQRSRPPIAYERGDLAGRFAIVDDGSDLAARLHERLTRDGCETVVCASPGAVPPGSRIIALRTRGDAELQSLACATSITIVTRGAIAAGAGERVHPDRAALRAFVRILGQEVPNAECALLDIGELQGDEAVETVLSEIASSDGAMFVARRGSRRLVPHYERIAAHGDVPIAQRRRWLITGGLGRVGVALADHLARRFGARLVLAGRTAPAALSSARRAAFGRIREAAGGDAVYVAADCTDPIALEQALRREGVDPDDIAYVVHAAAEIDRGTFHRPIAQLKSAELHAQLRSKRDGVRALEQLFTSGRVERAWLFSSVATLLGGVGYLAYSAANLISAAEAREGALPWQVIAWDVWTRAAEGEGLTLGSSLRGMEMPESGALEVFDLAASIDGDVIVSTADLAARLEQTRRIASQTHDSAGAAKAADVSVEEALVEACRRVIGRAPESLDMSLTDLGGDSLAATQLVLAMTRRLGVQIPIGEMLTAKSLRQFCDRAGFYRTYQSDASLMILQRAAAEPYRASVLQERWLKMEQRGYGYLEFFTLVEGPLDVPRFVRAIEAVCRRHDVLRTHYQLDDDGLRQIIVDEVPVVELHEGDVVVREERFDLLREAPLKISLTRFDDETHILVILTHHIAFDGWSSSLFLDDLARAYDAGAPLARGLQYADFAEWQRGYRRSQAFRSTLDYWSRHFAGAPAPLRLRPDVECAEPSRRGVKVHRMIGEATGRELSAAAVRAGTTVFPLLVTAYLALLSRESGKTDLVIGTTSNGRHLAGTEEVIGVFVNPLPVRFTFDPDAPIDAAIASVHERLLGFHDHQRVVLADILEHVGHFRGLDLNSLFRVYILYQNYPRSADAGGLRFTVPEVDDFIEHPRLARFAAHETTLMRDLELVIVPHGDALSCNFWYRADLYSAARVERWANEFCELARMIAAPGSAARFGDLIAAEPEVV